MAKNSEGSANTERLEIHFEAMIRENNSVKRKLSRGGKKQMVHSDWLIQPSAGYRRRALATSGAAGGNSGGGKAPICRRICKTVTRPGPPGTSRRCPGGGCHGGRCSGRRSGTAGPAALGTGSPASRSVPWPYEGGGDASDGLGSDLGLRLG